MYTIGIDLGTTSVKILIMDTQGDIIRSVSRTYPIAFPKALWAEQNPEDWFEAAVDGLKEALKNLDTASVAAISFSGQMHGLVMLDDEDTVIRPAILWNDQRSSKETTTLNRDIGVNALTRYTGNIAFPGFTAPKLLWVKHNEPEHFERIAKIMLPKDYLAYRMSGVFATDYADASGTLYLDVAGRRWSPDMCALLGIEVHMLPTLFESYAPIGEVRQELADALGLPSNVAVVIGSGDQACAAVGGGVVRPGICSVSLGTSGVVFVHADTFTRDPENGLHAFCHANGAYHLMGCMLSAAGALKWWGEDILRGAEYEPLLAEAETAPIQNGLFFLPYLMGERSPHNDPNARGTFWGLTLSHGTGDMTRAVLEGVAFALKDSFEIVRRLGISISEVRINGGGSKSDFWCQMIADVLNVPVVKLKTDAGPAYGAAILAAVGAGIFRNVASACDAVLSTTHTYLPDSHTVALYQKKYTAFTHLYPHLKPLFGELAP